MRVYIAAPYAARDHVRDYWLPALARIGATSTASWLDEDHEINDQTIDAAPGISDEQADAHALQDFADIESSDVLILLTASAVHHITGKVTGGGRHVETGYALALGRYVVVVGEPENVFFHLAQSLETGASEQDRARGVAAAELLTKRASATLAAGPAAPQVTSLVESVHDVIDLAADLDEWVTLGERTVETAQPRGDLL